MLEFDPNGKCLIYYYEPSVLPGLSLVLYQTSPLWKDLDTALYHLQAHQAQSM